MSNTRKLRNGQPPRKPLFPIDALPPHLQDTVRKVAAAEHVTIAQAATALLLAASDGIGDMAVKHPDGEVTETEPLDIAFLAPDPADRPAVLRAYAALTGKERP